MRLYKPTIYRLAASEVIQTEFCCPAIGRACVILLSKGKPLSEEEWMHLHSKRTPIVEEFADYFKPYHKFTSDAWFDSCDIDHRILSLLLMAEITKGQYINIDLP